jgi:CRP/FNR family transcriptional regulator
MLPPEYHLIFEKELRERIESDGKLHRFAEGEVVQEIDQYIKSIPIILEGSLKIIREDEDGNELFLYYIVKGETCAMSLTCCMQDQKSKIRATGEEAGSMLAIPARVMDEWMMKYVTWKNFVLQTYSNRFEELMGTIDSIAFRLMDERLVDYLNEKSRIRKSRELQITHQEIAQDLHSSREAVSRLLKKLEQMGRVHLHRNRIELK